MTATTFQRSAVNYLLLKQQILALCSQGHLDRALHVLLHFDHHLPIGVYRSILKACNKKKALFQAKQVLSHVCQHSLDLTGSLGEYAVIVLANCGAVDEAQRIFLSLSHRTVFGWTAMISSFVNCGNGMEALKVYYHMQEEDVMPDQHTFVSLFKACINISDLSGAMVLHDEAFQKGIVLDSFMGASLVSMYSKCGSILDAENVFCAWSVRDAVLWNAMLSAYLPLGQTERALRLYRQMQAEEGRLNQQTFLIVLPSCTALTDKDNSCVDDSKQVSLEIGKALHADARRNELAQVCSVSSSIIGMYAKCGNIMEAENVFDGLLELHTGSWYAMLSAYVELGEGEKALQLYTQMQAEGVSPDQKMCTISLQACAISAENKDDVDIGGLSTILMYLQMGKGLHSEAIRAGFVLDVFVGSNLVSMYGKCGSIVDAEDVFQRLTERNVVSWSVMLSAYIEHGQGIKSLQLYRQMQEDRITPDQRTFVITLQACITLIRNDEAIGVDGQPSTAIPLEIGRGLHADARKKGYTSDVFVSNTLVLMYACSGSIVEAENVFFRMPKQNVVSWSGMLLGYIQVCQPEKALRLHNLLQEEGAMLNDVTLTYLLQACNETGSLDVCRQLHFNSTVTGHDVNPLIASALIRSYGSCASMVDAQVVFDRIDRPDIVVWTACIDGYAQEGNGTACFQVFKEMLSAGVTSTDVTFLSLISSFNHEGLVSQGLNLFGTMIKHHGFPPSSVHYGALVDLIGRAGDFDMVENTIYQMPMQVDLPIWSCLLHACRLHSNLDMGKHAFGHLMGLDPKETTPYVVMSNIYIEDR